MKLSASSLKLYAQCPRKWALQKLANIQLPQHPGASLGTEIHKVCERYAKREGFEGISKHALRCAMPALKYIKTVPQSAVETPFSFDLGTVTYHGYIDYTELRDGGNVLVRDWKSTKNLSYALSPEDLLEDEQTVLYAWAQYEAGAASVSAQWVYLCTEDEKPPKFSEVDVPKEHARKHLHVLQERALEMLTLAEAYEKDLDVAIAPANILACTQYRKKGQEYGCPHHPTNGGQCDPYANKEPSNMSSLAERMKTRKLTPAMLGMVETPAEPVAAFVAPPAAVTAPVAQDEGQLQSFVLEPVVATTEVVKEAKKEPKSAKARKETPSGASIASISYEREGFRIHVDAPLSQLAETVEALRDAVK